MTPRPLYPVQPAGPDDPGLDEQTVNAVAYLLLDYGFPPFDAGSPDEDRLRTALAWFTYGTPLPDADRGAGDALEYCPTCGERMDWIRSGEVGHLAGAPCAEPVWEDPRPAHD